MKIALIIPFPNWMEHLYYELKDLRNEVLINNCSENCDVILGMSHNVWNIIQQVHQEFPLIPLIVLNQDWYDYVDKTEDNWKNFIPLMKESKEIWSLSKAVADQCEEKTGMKSKTYLHAYIIPREWGGKKNDYGYILQASREDKNKRFEWFIKAAQELNIPYRVCHPNKNSREDYILNVKNCSIVVVASREESIGGITAMEGAYCKKPILVGDNPGAKEVWGEDAHYFKTDSFFDFKKQLKWLWDNRYGKGVKKRIERAYNRVETKFLPHHMALRINNRLKQIL